MWPFQRKKKSEVKAKRAYYLAAKENTEEREIDVMASKVRWALQHSFNKEIIFLCIGSDRSTGDSLGPIIGSMLKEKQFPYPIYGTLEEPVHALNLEKVLKEIYKTYEEPIVFGIDACLGDEKQIGYILFKEEPFIPGNALNKALPKVGDFHMRAIVNYLDPISPAQSLNNTRLYEVVSLAKIITKIITRATVVEHSSSS
ncbi:spore protease YyaC [Bacillus aerolatus]|uniref:Spore protease YyaC n=2 Tax=Bacillus aerolatus TaxID=2653354 RepID=A0A6I1FHW8_9BACI|nr:spore protease YyaC [Bacillus aerolatus]